MQLEPSDRPHNEQRKICEPNQQVTIEESRKDIALSTSFGHRGFSLISISFLIFAIFFLFFYASELSLKINLTWLGIPLAVLSLTIGHLMLKLQESSVGCKLFSPVWKGTPPFVYENWLILNAPDREPGITFGARHILFDIIDKLDLTIWGNLLVRTNRLCGPRTHTKTKTSHNTKVPSPYNFDTVLRIPFSVSRPGDRKLFIKIAKSCGPHIVLNNRLEKVMKEKDIPGTKWVSGLGVIFLLFVLIDNGYSDFRYLEILKQYYLAQTEAQKTTSSSEQLKTAKECLSRGDGLHNTPQPFSWISSEFLSKGTAAQEIYQTRADALWQLGYKQEAVTCAKQALAFSPTNFRINLKLARLLENTGQDEEAKAQIKKAIEIRERSLLPRLYMLAVTIRHSPSEAIKLYKHYQDEFSATVFDPQPVWPPGGNRFLNELWYQEDVKFVFDRLLKAKGK